MDGMSLACNIFLTFVTLMRMKRKLWTRLRIHMKFNAGALQKLKALIYCNVLCSMLLLFFDNANVYVQIN